MIVSALSYIIARVFNTHNMYWSHLIHEDNVHPDEDHSLLNAMSLDSIINYQYKAVDKQTPVADFFKILADTKVNIFAVLDKSGSLEGVIWLDEIRKSLFTAVQEGHTVEDIMVAPPAVIEHDDPMSEVMDTFDGLDVWQLPVVKDGVFIGFISKSAVLNKYREVIIHKHQQADLFAR
ncbi:CBS domain-containing protein [Mucilaginibacter conchicola]|uniref:CBS domain-containing protein n=2 Tax=Mucilaginibacter conchicola TaxID=2303333 RepID=A0A372P096_9SPHI|nr:CBS domain-containing protein [Mucilaginibacter conchicola]